MRIHALASLILLVLPLAGCVTADQVARTRAANDFKCEEDKVDILAIGGTSYRAEGCGRIAVYDCAASDSYRGTTSDYACIPEKQASETPPK